MAPVLEIGRRRREETVKRVRNPEGGTYRVWKPGTVDLRADVAVGAENLKRVGEVPVTSAEFARCTLKGIQVHGRRRCFGADSTVAGKPRCRKNGEAGVANQ